jgi:hypothetical protein
MAAQGALAATTLVMWNAEQLARETAIWAAFAGEKAARVAQGDVAAAKKKYAAMILKRLCAA